MAEPRGTEEVASPAVREATRSEWPRLRHCLARAFEDDPVARFLFPDSQSRVRRLEAGTGIITTVLGDGVSASSGQGSPAHSFPVNRPFGLACDSVGNLYVSSTSTVRLVIADDAGVVDGTGQVQTVFGAPPRDDYPASVARCLTGIAVVDDETVQVVDSCAGVLVELARQPVP